MSISQEEPILSRIDRLDNMLKELEEIKGRRSSSTSDENVSSIDDLSPRSFEKHCRPIRSVVVETQLKGSLIHRLFTLENRLQKMEQELVKQEQNKSNKGFKQLVKQCVKGRPKKKPSFS